MFCTNCGKEIADNAKFCKYCGNNIVPTNLENRNKRIHSDNVKKSNDKKRIKRFSVMGAGLLVLVIGLIVVNLIITNKKYVDIGDPLVERCIRETLNKEDDEKITLEECASIKSLLIDCQYDTSFSITSCYAFPSFMACNYVDFSDFKYLSGLEELYIDNSNNSDFIANFGAITNCPNLRRLHMQYNPCLVFDNGEPARGYKYLAEIIKQLPELEYIDLGHYVLEEYQVVLRENNPNLLIFNGVNDSYLDMGRLSVKNESDNMFWADTIAEYKSNWVYKYNGNEPNAKSTDAKTTKAGLSVSTKEELDKTIEQLPENIEDIFIKVSIDELDMTVFERFDNLKTLSIVGQGKVVGTSTTKLTNTGVLRNKKELFSLNIAGCSGEFSGIGDMHSLKQLSLVYCSWETSEFLSGLTQLRELTLLYNKLYDGSYDESLKENMEQNNTKYKELKFLRVLDENSLKGIENFPNLETLYAWGIGEGVKTFEYISNCSNLKHIIIPWGCAEGVDLTPLKQLRELETLCIEYSYVNNLDSVINLPKICTVSVKNITEQYDHNYVNMVNEILEQVIASETMSFFDIFRGFAYEEIPYEQKLENIQFEKLYDANVFDGEVQSIMCRLPRAKLTYDEAYTLYICDYLYADY